MTAPMPAPTTALPVASSDRALHWLGVLLLVAAALVFVVPTAHPSLQAVGTTDSKTLDSAGYENGYGLGAVEAPRLRAGDGMLRAIMSSNQAAAQNEHVADKRMQALLLGLPGAYLLGLTAKRRRG